MMIHDCQGFPPFVLFPLCRRSAGGKKKQHPTCRFGTILDGTPRRKENWWIATVVIFIILSPAKRFLVIGRQSSVSCALDNEPETRETRETSFFTGLTAVACVKEHFSRRSFCVPALDNDQSKHFCFRNKMCPSWLFPATRTTATSEVPQIGSEGAHPEYLDSSHLALTCISCLARCSDRR